MRGPRGVHECEEDGGLSWGGKGMGIDRVGIGIEGNVEGKEGFHGDAPSLSW